MNEQEKCGADAHLDPTLPKVFTGDPDFDELLVKCRDILGFKGRDYTIGAKDRLANFRRGGEKFGCSPGLVLGVFWDKHVAAVCNYIRTGGQQESEPIEGRIADVINYMLLFYKMVKEQQRAREKTA